MIAGRTTTARFGSSSQPDSAVACRWSVTERRLTLARADADRAAEGHHARRVRRVLHGLRAIGFVSSRVHGEHRERRRPGPSAVRHSVVAAVRVRAADAGTGAGERPEDVPHQDVPSRLHPAHRSEQLAVVLRAGSLEREHAPRQRRGLHHIVGDARTARRLLTEPPRIRAARCCPGCWARSQLRRSSSAPTPWSS